jgi:hypothetical protein
MDQRSDLALTSCETYKLRWEVRVSSQATCKAATEETRDRAERGSAVRGSDRATVVAGEDTHTDFKQ